MIRFNPGGSNQEDRQIKGFSNSSQLLSGSENQAAESGSFILDSPLQFDHEEGENIIRIEAPEAGPSTPTATQPAAPLPPATGGGGTAEPFPRTVSILGIIALLVSAGATAAALQRRGK